MLAQNRRGYLLMRSFYRNKLLNCFFCFMVYLGIVGSGLCVPDKTITLEVSNAELIAFDEPVIEVFIANPEIADVQLSNRNFVYVFGKVPGNTTLFAVNGKGNIILERNIQVIQDLKYLKDLIHRNDPDDLVEVLSVPNGVILEGLVENPKTAEAIQNIAAKFVGKGQTVINQIEVKAPVQVELRVKIAEVKRGALNKLGVNWQGAFQNIGNFNFGVLTGRSPFTGVPFAANNTTTLTQPTALAGGSGANISSLGAGFQDTRMSLNSAIDLLSQDGLVTVLAEPNLVAVSGETANFLAGGEFPYPVPQSLGTTTIEFRQFGVSLSFTPTVISNDLISLRVRPEVSDLDFSTGLRFNNVDIPGLIIRRAETTVELGSGQTFAIAGLIKNKTESQINAVPGLGDLPILGPLFRSNSFKKDDTEVVILVTPYLVQPVSGKEMQLPTDGLQYATFIEQVLERRLIKTGPEKGKASPIGPGGARLIGPAGFTVD